MAKYLSERLITNWLRIGWSHCSVSASRFWLCSGSCSLGDGAKIFCLLLRLFVIALIYDCLVLDSSLHAMRWGPVYLTNNLVHTWNITCSLCCIVLCSQWRQLSVTYCRLCMTAWLIIGQIPIISLHGYFFSGFLMTGVLGGLWCLWEASLWLGPTSWISALPGIWRLLWTGINL